MRKFYAFFAAALMSVSVFAAKDVVPSDAVLADYYEAGNVCVCFFVPADMNCNNIVLTGSFNGWSSTVAECVPVEAVEGYDGWYVASFEPEAEPGDQGMCAKPIMLDAFGAFNWEYQIGAATAIRGGVQVVQGAYAGEIDLINYGADAPNVFTVDAWKQNPCTAIYHNYTVTVISDGCNNLVVPFIVGGLNGWKFEQMQVDQAATIANQAPTYFFSFKAAEGTPYQIVSGIMVLDEAGQLDSITPPAWSDDSYMQMLVEDSWVRIPGEEGDNQLTHEEANIVWDLRVDTLRWARCAPAEPEEYVVMAVRFPVENRPESVEIIGTFDGWEGTSMELIDTGWHFAKFNAKASQYFKFRSAGSWDQELEVYDAENDEWKKIGDNQFVFGQLWVDDTYKGEACKWIEMDMFNPAKYRWTVAEEGIENVVLTEKAQKVMVDGVMYIIRDNKMFNVQGTQVR
jgi:hypothetical protein